MFSFFVVVVVEGVVQDEGFVLKGKKSSLICLVCGKLS